MRIIYKHTNFTGIRNQFGGRGGPVRAPSHQEQGARAAGAAAARRHHAPLHAAHLHAAAAGVPRAGRARGLPAEHVLHHGRGRRRRHLRGEGYTATCIKHGIYTVHVLAYLTHVMA